MKWSYSGLSLFEQCQRKYYETRVLRKYKQEDTTALMYGKEAHSAAEHHIKQNAPLAPKFLYMQKYLDVFKSIEGKKHCELQLGLRKDLTPCGFDDADVWWRGIADLVVDQGDTIFLVDYKTGKTSRYADLDQLEILSLALFKHFPQVQKIKGGLLFVIAEDFKDETYHRNGMEELWLKWFNKIQRMEEAEKNGIYNEIPNFTCRNYCPCIECPHCGN